MHTEANSFQDFGLVIAALNIAIRPGDIHGVQDLVKPVSVGIEASPEFLHLHQLR